MVRYLDQEASPSVLQSLAAGQLLNRLPRAVRAWVLLRSLYGDKTTPGWVTDLPPMFRYAHLRDRLFAESHPKADTVNIDEVQSLCRNAHCLCHQSLRQLVLSPQQSEADWIEGVQRLSGLSMENLNALLESCPFATVHRSLRDDLKFLVQLGWLRSPKPGYYAAIDADEAPDLAQPPTSTPTLLDGLTETQLWTLLRVLESVSFVQPQLEVVMQTVWEQAQQVSSQAKPLWDAPQQRLFIHLDYILSDEVQERVDGYQAQIEELWHYPTAGVIRFDYWLAKTEQLVTVTVYPVCLHYARRAKYLSAYGIDPSGLVQWHNYRLDRVRSPSLTVLPWGDPSIPQELRTMWRTGSLPTSADIQQALTEAWGFNFYLPRSLLILRFSPQFAQWYVDNTIRHPTFQPIDYADLWQRVQQDVSDPTEQAAILRVLALRSPNDAYYQGWIRVPDINVTMRLRDWRSNGEVIAPIAVRQQMRQEVATEMQFYAQDD